MESHEREQIEAAATSCFLVIVRPPTKPTRWTNGSALASCLLGNFSFSGPGPRQR